MQENKKQKVFTKSYGSKRVALRRQISSFSVTFVQIYNSIFMCTNKKISVFNACRGNVTLPWNIFSVLKRTARDAKVELELILL